MSTCLLQYRCAPGQTFEFEQQVSLLVEKPGAEPVADTAEIGYTVSVAEVHADGTASLQIHAVVKKQFDVYPALQDESTLCRLNGRGEVLSADPRPPVVPFIVFPESAVALKETWHSNEASGLTKLAMEHSVTALEAVGDDVYAHVVSEGKADGPPALELYAVRVFSVNGGHLVLGRSVMKSVTPEGVTSTLVVEEKMRGV